MRTLSLRPWLRLTAPAMVLVAASFWNTFPAAAKPEYTRRTKQGCEICHPPGSRALNEAGEYFRDHRSLDGYKPRERNQKAVRTSAKGK